MRPMAEALESHLRPPVDEILTPDSEYCDCCCAQSAHTSTAVAQARHSSHTESRHRHKLCEAKERRRLSRSVRGSPLLQWLCRNQQSYIHPLSPPLRDASSPLFARSIQYEFLD